MPFSRGSSNPGIDPAYPATTTQQADSLPLTYQGSPRILSRQPIPSPVDRPDPGIEPGSPSLQVDSLLAEGLITYCIVKSPILDYLLCYYCDQISFYFGLPWQVSGKESACYVVVAGYAGSIPGLEDPLEKGMATPVFLPGESHGQRSLVGYSPWVSRVRHDLATKPPPPGVCSGAQSCLSLCDPMDSSPPSSSVHGIFQSRILEWVAISSRRSF